MARVLAGSVVAAGGLLAVPVAGPAHAAPHAVAPTVQRIALTPAGGAAGRVAAQGARPPAPAVATGELATKPFDLVAVSWIGGASPSVAVRVRERGAWGGWSSLQPGDDGPDGGSADAAGERSAGARRSTAPLLVDHADGVQVRVGTADGAAPASLAVDLVDGGRSAADAPSGPAATAAADTGQPRIVTRAEWGADEALVKSAPVINSEVRALVLHHTDTRNDYSPSEAYAQVRSLYAFHTRVRGWNDVGYNFVVDRFGRTYEGRRGSITAAVMGAHAGGFNAQTLGIAVLGTFTSASVPPAVEDALAPLVAWKSAEFGINPAGRTALTSAGGGYTSYRAGAQVPVRGLIGHRDVDQTACPGDRAYPRLGALRVRAAALMRPDLVGPSVTGSPAVPTAEGGALTFNAVIPTKQKWWMSMTPLCGGPVIRTVSGTATGRITGSWNLTDSGGAPVPPGAYRVTVTSSSPVGIITPWRTDVEVLPTSATVFPPAGPPAGPSADPSPSPSPSASPGSGPGAGAPPAGAPPATPIASCPVRRVGATDPDLMSVLAGRLAQPDARTVVLVNPAAVGPFADALAVAPLAAAQHAPVLLTGAAALPAVVAQDVTARGTTTAWIVGSTASIGAGVEEQLRGLGVTTVHRLSGPDAAGTAAAVAAVVGAPAHEAVLVPADPGERLDALVGAASAASAGRPVLLTTRAKVPAATLAALRALRVTSVTVIGGTVAVPPATLGVLARSGVTRTSRIVGRDRWSTAVAVAGTLGATAPADRVVLTSGLVARADLLLASAQGRPVLLTSDAGLPAATAAWLTAHPVSVVALVATPATAGTPVLRAAQDAISRSAGA